MVLQVNFEEPLMISSEATLDVVVLEVVNPDMFVSLKTGKSIEADI